MRCNEGMQESNFQQDLHVECDDAMDTVRCDAIVLNGCSGGGFCVVTTPKEKGP